MFSWVVSVLQINYFIKLLYLQKEVKLFQSFILLQFFDNKIGNSKHEYKMVAI